MGKSTRDSVIYITRIIAGIIIFWIPEIVALYISDISMNLMAKNILLVVVGLTFFGLIPLVFHIYQNLDELERHLYGKTCIVLVGCMLPALGTIGILEIGGIIPSVNGLWIFGVALIILGITLMLTDREYR